MFCNRCGSPVNDGDRVCAKCGAPIQMVSQEPVTDNSMIYNMSQTGNELQDKKNKIIGMSAVGAAALIVIIIAVALLGGRSYKKTVKQLMACVFDTYNAKTFISLFNENMLEAESGYSKDNIKEQADETMEMLESSVEKSTGGIKKYSYKIVENEKYDKEDLNEIKELCSKKYDIKVSSARDVELTSEVKCKNGDEENFNFEVTLIKVGRSWYIYDIDSSSGFNII